MQLLTVTVSGGEPFFYPHIRPLLERIVQGKMRFKLMSNGTLIDRNTVDFLSSLRRCELVQISLDGDERVHDAIRGAGNFKKALQAVELLCEAGLPVVTNTVITRENFRDLLSLARRWEKLPLKYYRFTPVNAEGKVTPDLLTLEELAEVIAQLELHRAELPHLYRSNSVTTYLKDIRAPRPGVSGCARCSGTFASIGVHPNGDVTPCVDYFGMTVGNVREKSLREIWNDLPYQEFRARVKRGVERNSPRCEGCPYKIYCRKFCFLQTNEYYCRRELAKALQRRGVAL